MDAEVVEDVDDVDDWLCAASSALIVSGDICEQPPLDPVLVLVLWLVEVEALLEKSNGLLLPWPKPVDCVDDDFDDSSA